MFGYGASIVLMGPVIKSATHGWMLRLPSTLVIATFMGVQAANWQRPSKPFHELMSQPAPHGSYLRRSIKEHFPVWWQDTSANLHVNGYSLPQMNEYDKSTSIPKGHTHFDSSRF